MKKVPVFVAASTLAAALLFTPAASAESILQCDDNIGGGTYSSVVVSSGDNCVLESVEVTGDLRVDDGGSLRATYGTTVAGNLSVKPGGTAVVQDGEINGSYACSGADDAGCELTRTTVRGNVSIRNSDGSADISDSIILGDTLLSGNTSSTVSGNKIAGNLICRGNDRIDSFSANLVVGERHDQCGGENF